MKFEEIFAQHLSLRVKPKDEKEKLADIDVLSVKTTFIRGEFEIRTKNTVTTVVPCSLSDVNALTDVLSTGQATLAVLVNSANDGSAELQLTSFFGEQLEMGDIEIGIDESVQTYLKKDSLDDAAKTLFGKCVFSHGGKKYFFLVAGSAADAYLEARREVKQNDDDKQPSDDTNQEVDEATSDDNLSYEGVAKTSNDGREYRQFAVIGADIRFRLSEKDIGLGRTIFLASGITRTRNKREDSALRLACGNLKFVDWTVAGERAILAKAQLDKITQNEGSYLRKWDEFGKVEGELFLEQTRNIGVIPFTVKEENKDGTILVQCGELSAIQKETLPYITELDVVDEDDTPAFLHDKNMTFDDFVNGTLEDEGDDFLGEWKIKKKKQSSRELSATFKIADCNAATGEIRLKADSLPPGGYLICSIAGEIAQIKRRMKARKAIQDQRAANPNLGLLIEENGFILPSQPPPKIKAMSELVRRKIFSKNPPTPAQERAIEVALNTPDIALIQGPPGTGKTTVIAAIIERLNQEADKRNGMRGKILLSGFQHDAVENMIERININGLPVPKFGQRSGAEENADFTHYEVQLQEWCDDRIRELKAKNPQISESIKERQIKDLCVQYIKAPTLRMAEALLNEVLTLPDRTLGENLRIRIQEELKHLRNEQNQETLDSSLLNVIRGLRVSENGFADDGADRVGDAFFALKNELEDSDRKLLQQAMGWLSKEGKPPFLAELRKLKGKLLMCYTPAPMFRMEKVRDTVLSLINETCEKIRRNGMSVRDKKNAALAELLMAMENNPYGMVDTVKDYSFAFAATCQQSVNMKMQQLKGINPSSSNQKLEYDFVIVDEAARVSPRDLMIPMSQGKRIILVGDHRQLPQLIDENVAKRMEEGKEEAGEEDDWLKKSMFEYLFTERLAQLEKADGIQRRVTLDMQYRTHPLLGDFISRNFYESHNPEEKFGSGLKEDKFAYDLPETNGKCAIWLNVPDGAMSHAGTSRTRPAEAETICRKLKEWIAYDNNRTATPKEQLTFGVISFYKAQTELIKRTLGDRFLDSVGGARLRIGTVDSFQGMEFDVVFLSLVRTGREPKFGFLQLYNRLNVSMSRQKKLLVVVGNADYYDTVEAGKKVPGIKDFLKLCREKGAVL